MKIRSIEIRSLFGYFDHKIPMKTSDRITIIHGPNGVGKTTVLRLIHDLFKRQFYSLLSTPFDRIVVYFKPKGSLTVTRTKEEELNDATKLQLTYRLGGKKTEYTVSLKAQKTLRRYPNILDRAIDNIERVGPSEWYDELTDKTMSYDEVVLLYGQSLPPEIRRSISPIPEEIKNLLETINIVVVETQRLFTRRKDEELGLRHRGEVPAQRVTVEQYSEDMISRIQQDQRDSGVLGASLDRTFPQRLLEAELPQTATEESIRKEYASQSEYRDRLMRSGLIAAETAVSLPSGGLAENERKVLSIYLDDVKHKLEVFDQLLRRVELFKDIVNSRFSYKKFRVDREKGFIFESDHNESIVPPRSLSSGEQHEIVLAYQLLFRAPAGSLIFIDEPELSLHVTWQRKFLEDIARISELADLDFLVATHSPSIIHNRRDLMVQLAGGEEG